MKYKLILFDLDGTLFDYDKAEKSAFEGTLSSFGISDDLAYLNKKYKEINTKIWQEFQEGSITAKKLRTERFRILFEQEKIDLIPFDFSKKYLENLSRSGFLLNGAEDIVSYLSDKFHLSLITNGLMEVQYSRIGNSVLKKYFRDIFVSEEIGFPKPDPRIFDHVFSKLPDFKKEEALIVGDNLTSDIKGGNDYGIDSCWFNEKQYQNKIGVEATYEIEKLEELKEILE